jgi:mono/diheme cytochrome c family protein
VFGSPDAATALVVAAFFIALLFALLSYHAHMRHYVYWGIGLLVATVVLTLLTRALAHPGLGSSLVLILVMIAVMMVLLTYHSRVWAHAVWWMGALLFLLALPFLGAGRGDLAILALIGGPGLLMLVAALHPEVPATYARFATPGESPAPTADDLAEERHRYARLAGVLTVSTLAGVWLFGGIPQAEVAAAFVPQPVDQAAAARGAELFQQYGCIACHSVTTTQPGVGPALVGLYGKQQRLTTGQTIIADDEYIAESISLPDAKIVSGYSSGVMSSAIAPNLPEIRQPNNLRALVEYIKSLR